MFQISSLNYPSLNCNKNKYNYLCIASIICLKLIDTNYINNKYLGIFTVNNWKVFNSEVQ